MFSISFIYIYFNNDLQDIFTVIVQLIFVLCLVYHFLYNIHIYMYCITGLLDIFTVIAQRILCTLSDRHFISDYLLRGHIE